jgi:DegV family protein with EDD domain
MIRVVTDSASDLPDGLAAELGIEVVPLSIRFGTEEFPDSRQLSPADFWAKLQSSSALPETSAPSVGAFEAKFSSLIDDGATGIVCINLSSKLSATMQSAQLAARALDGPCAIEVVDSLNASIGEGNLCITAARMAAAGADLSSILTLVKEQRRRTRLYGALDTLEFLRKGGRIGGAQALLGSILSIKPIIKVVDGVVEPAAKVRTRSKAINWILDEAQKHPIERIAVLNGDAPDVDEFVDRVKTLFPKEDVIVAPLGAVIGTHTGPRCLGLTWLDARP